MRSRALGIGIVALALAATMTVPATAASGLSTVGADQGQVAADAAGTCYSNIDTPGTTLTMSQNFQPILNAYDSAAADDFRLRRACTVRSVQIVGGDNELPRSETVTFYKNDGGKPGKVINKQTVVGTTDANLFDIPLEPVRLRKGAYWVSVVANLSGQVGQWYWFSSLTEKGAPAVWQNPNGGWQYGCTTWTEASQCLGFRDGADQALALSK